MNTDAFVNANVGKNLTVTGPDAGQCTAVPHAWEKTLGLPIVYGDAKDTFANAGPQYERISFGPGVVPIPGDIPVWNENWGGGKGHTGLILSATPAYMTVFNQNNPTGTPAHIQQIGYSRDLIGFIRPKGADMFEGRSAADWATQAKDAERYKQGVVNSVSWKKGMAQEPGNITVVIDSLEDWKDTHPGEGGMVLPPGNYIVK